MDLLPLQWWFNRAQVAVPCSPGVAWNRYNSCASCATAPPLTVALRRALPPLAVASLAPPSLLWQRVKKSIKNN